MKPWNSRVLPMVPALRTFRVGAGRAPPFLSVDSATNYLSGTTKLCVSSYHLSRAVRSESSQTSHTCPYVSVEALAVIAW
jgi:hypothetical protein